MICQSNDTRSTRKGTACVLCNGCPENRIDSARVQRYLCENGWYVTEDYRDADLILFDACALTGDTATLSLRIVKEIQREKKTGSTLAVWGCLPKIDPEVLRSEFQGLTFGEAELSILDQLTGSVQSIEKTTANYLGTTWPVDEHVGKGLLIRYEGSPLTRFFRGLALRWQDHYDSRFNICRENDPSFFYIKIATGCTSNCSYCGVRKSRGTIKSKPIQDVVDEFQEGFKRGFKNFSLLGTDLGAYGKDMGYNLTDLLTQIVKQEGGFRIGIRNLNPYHLKNMLTKLTPILETNRIWYIECPVESGSDRILGLMNRNYTIEEYKDCLQTIRATCPRIVIRTQLMAGFPTETEQDFAETTNLLDEEIFDCVEVYQYSERPGTLAATMKPMVPQQTRKQRYLKLSRKALLNRTPRKIKNLIQNTL
jgi:tRNA A37 methylthiotransferase MiaB